MSGTCFLGFVYQKKLNVTSFEFYTDGHTKRLNIPFPQQKFSGEF